MFFCDYFNEVFVNEGNMNIDSVISHTEDTNVEITEKKVRKMLYAAKIDKSPGPDGIHPLFLHNTAEEVAGPLTLIFKKSLAEGILLHDWKRANITPIYKKGARNEAGNYRPVSFTSVVCEILEVMIKDSMLQFLVESQWLTLKHHGFVSGRLCLTNLLESFENWSELLDEGHGIDVIYLDYRKAFDTVPHKRLLTKVQQGGIGGRVLNRIKAFLSDREMSVVVNKHFFAWAPVVSGVPQASVLGPLLFLMYVNDVPDWIVQNMRMFVDDKKLWSKISGLSDCVHLQADLDQLSIRSDKWLLSFNPDKCKVMRVVHSFTTHYCKTILHTDYWRLRKKGI